MNASVPAIELPVRKVYTRLVPRYHPPMPPANRSWPRKLRRFLVWSGFALLGLTLLALIVAGSAWWYFHPAFAPTHGVVYGTRQGHALILEVARPAKPNGLGVALLVSGGWKSGTNGFHPWMAAPLLRRGYTVFGVTHVSQPEASILEIAAALQHKQVEAAPGEEKLVPSITVYPLLA